MPAIEEAQGKGDKLQSAPGVKLVREVLELFTVLQKSFKDAAVGAEMVRSVHTQYGSTWPDATNSNILILSHKTRSGQSGK